MEKKTDEEMEKRKRIKSHFSVFSISQAERIMKILEGTEEDDPGEV